MIRPIRTAKPASEELTAAVQWYERQRADWVESSSTQFSEPSIAFPKHPRPVRASSRSMPVECSSRVSLIRLCTASVPKRFAFSRSLSGGASGFGVEAIGYAGYFFLTFFLAFPAYFFLPWVKRLLAAAEGTEPARGDAR